MSVQLREKKVGPYTVRELSMRDTMRLLREYKELGSEERGAAMLGASVFNGTEQPLGLAVLDLGSGLYRKLMQAHTEVNDASEYDPMEGDEGNA